VGEIVDFFDLSQPTITRHLQTLTAAGLVVRTKKAQRVYYGINRDQVASTCITLAACFPGCCTPVKTGIQISTGEDKKPPGTKKRARRKSDKPKPERTRR
jgi:DNA-binding transcriptional ArsR family regulator